MSKRGIKYAIDAVCQDFVEGWALGPSGRCEVEVVVDGRPVGRAVTGLSRDDVAAALPDIPNSAAAGFLYVFGDGEVVRGHHDASVSLRITADGLAINTEKIAIPVLDPAGGLSVLAEERRDASRSPFPRATTDLLLRASPTLAGVDLASEAGALAAVDVLEHVVRRGPRPLPGVHRYLKYLRAVHGAALFAAQYFPRGNPRATGDKDRTSMLTGPYELIAIAHHLFVLADAGVPGPLLEFGCYKGYSTSVLSNACHLLGRTMDVFDSFQGLPSSTSTHYRAGEFAGGLAEVTGNVAEFGQPDVVSFHSGFFNESVPLWPARPIACLWMDVDLQESAVDTLKTFPHLDARGALFSHECGPASFDGGRPVPRRGPEEVVGPIVDAFVAAGRDPVGRFVSGCTGAFWDARTGVPVLPTPAFERVVRLALV